MRMTAVIAMRTERVWLLRAARKSHAARGVAA
jgi:hypothetical protein